MDLSQATQIRILCILLVIQGIVSYRSIPRILNLLDIHTRMELCWIPHFTSVINWTLRVGLGLLNQVKAISEPWIAIIDHSIDIGTKKALVVLRIPVNIFSQRKGAVQLEDCECVGLHVSEVVNGNTVAQELKDIFKQAGVPAAIIKDGDYTLNKGVNLYQEEQELAIPVIEDISHVMARVLKKQFEETEDYRQFTSLISQGAKKLRQTALAFLAPPKLRTKGRFMSIGRLGKWGEKMLEVLTGRFNTPNNALQEKLYAAFPDIEALRPFIKSFACTVNIVSKVMKILKNKGLEQNTYAQCWQFLETLPDNNQKVKQRLQLWLQRHLAVQKEITEFPLLISSDIIESLFGNFKHIIERSPQADMNRSTLLIPALCGHLDEITIQQALKSACHADLQKWEQENISCTLRKKRQEIFKNIKPKTGEKQEAE